MSRGYTASSKQSVPGTMAAPPAPFAAPGLHAADALPLDQVVQAGQRLEFDHGLQLAAAQRRVRDVPYMRAAPDVDLGRRRAPRQHGGDHRRAERAA